MLTWMFSPPVVIGFVQLELEHRFFFQAAGEVAVADHRIGQPGQAGAGRSMDLYGVVTGGLRGQGIAGACFGDGKGPGCRSLFPGPRSDI